MSENLHVKFGIDDENLAIRREFIHLRDEDRKVLEGLKAWSDKIAPEIAKEFYEWQFTYPATKSFFEGFAKQHRMSMQQLRRHLEESQAGYFRGIFEGASANWGVGYFESRLHIGAVHDRINLPLKWYIGSYMLYEELLPKYLAKHYGSKAAQRDKALLAIRKVMNYDMQAIADSFLMSTMESIGLSVGAIECEEGQDRTEALSQIKGAVDTLKKQADAIAAGRFQDEALKTQVEGALGETFARAVESLQALLSQAQAIARGKLDDPVLEKEVPGDLGATFTQMSQSLNQIISGIHENTAGLAQTAVQLQKVSKTLTQNAEETSAQANNASAASEEVSKSIQTIAAGSDEMNSTIKEVARNVSEAAKIAQNASHMAESTNTIVGKLSESSEQINNVVKVITDIAEQTNLLALNATIEAARAGEAGKGFAVVANEVKELAKETTRSTGEIRSQVKRIQDDTSAAVDAIQKIGEIIRRINDTQTMIATAVEEQTATTAEISHNIAEAARGSGEIARNVAEVATAAQSTEGSAGQTSGAANELARMTDELKTGISVFSVRKRPAREGAHEVQTVRSITPR